MVERVSSAADVEVMKDAYYNYVGHRNLLPQKMIDQLMHKALEVGQPELMFDFHKFHQELLYHPHPSVS